MTTTFAWVLHANDEGTANGKRKISVNWVMPSNGVLGESPEVADIFNDVGQLMWPWAITIVAWWEAGGGPKPTKLAADQFSTIDNVLGIQDVMRAELIEKCALCQVPYSLDIADLSEVPGKTSLPHLFAPLTHLPAGVSHDMLGMSRSFVCDDAALPVACAPEFQVEIDGRMVCFTPHELKTIAGGRIDHLTIGYSAAHVDDASTYSDIVFSIITRPVSPMRETVTMVPALHAAERGEVATRAVLALNALAPLPLLGRLLEQGSAWPQDGAGRAMLLNRALGPGLLRFEDRRPVWIWERVATLDPGEADGLLGHWSDDAAVYDALLAALKDDASGLTPQTRQQLGPVLTAPGSVAEFAKAVGRLLAGAEGRQAIASAWLAAVATVHLNATRLARSTPAPPLHFREWLALLTPVCGDDSVAELQKAWWQYWLPRKFPAAAGEMEQIGITAERWIAGDLDLADIAPLGARYGRVLALLASAAPPGAPALDGAAIEPSLAALHQRLRMPEPARPVSLGEERDLAVALTFDDPVGAVAGSGTVADEELRGFAIAMSAGFTLPQAELGMAWITDTAGSIRTAAGWTTFEGAANAPLRLHDTVGATTQNGRSVVAFPYVGKPLNGAMGTDGIDGLAFGWPAHARWQTPKLAYGLRYWANGAAIGNGGRILDSGLWLNGDDRRLVEASAALFSAQAPFRYLCRVAPGAISVRTAEPVYAMEGESRGWHRQQSLASTSRVRVGVIRPAGAGWRASAPQSMRFDLIAPDATPLVLERWIEADIAQRKVPSADGAGLRDPASERHDSGQLAQYLAAMLKGMRQAPPAGAEPQRGPRHPAVRAIGARVRFDGDATSQDFVLTPSFYIEHGYLKPGHVVCLASAASSASATADTLTLSLQPGAIAEVSFWSLAPEEFFAVAADGPAVARMANFAGDIWTAGGKRYRAFGEARHHFECLPAADNIKQQALDALKQVQEQLAFAADGNDMVAQLSSAQGVDARWLKGFLVQRHEWHWAGYPLALPRKLAGNLELEDWSEAFAGSESLRESQLLTLQTDTAGAWRFGTMAAPAPLSRLRLPGRHGARFFACILRPLLRFGDWLQPQAEVERKIVAKGRLVAAKVDWGDPALRLAPPTVRAAIPLVRSFRVDGDRIHAAANGALICLDDVLCRTDALAHHGGVGELVEVDLEETRINNVFEIGANPLFHAGPLATVTEPAQVAGDGVSPPRLEAMSVPYAHHYGKDGAALAHKSDMDWGIEADRPFGLTHDLDRNPQVAQTAIVVRPTGADVGTYWIMAKVRLRRLLDPHAAWTGGDELPPAPGATPPVAWLLGRRPEGDDRIPFDFAVEAPAGAGFRLALDGAPGLDLAAAGSGGQGRRLLCSWHKGYWRGTSEVSWGLQVRDQLLLADGDQWRTVGRYSPYETMAATTGLTTKTDAPVALHKPAACQARRLLLSDYGDAHWLTFIGTPFRHPSFADERFQMQKSGKEILLNRTSAVSGTESISRDLLINPVEPGDLGGTPGADRATVETNTFHLLLVFAHINDVAAPPGGQHLGQLAGVYKPLRDAITSDKPYPPLRFAPYTREPKDSQMPEAAVGFIYKFQSTGSNPKDWEALQAGLFPAPPDEATVRWLPEFVGPITGAPLEAAPALSGRAIRIELGTDGGVDLTVDAARGWRRKKVSSPKTGWQDDIDGGVCSIRAGAAGQVLCIEGGGGRLLAQLEPWPMATNGDVIVYDAQQTGKAGTWRASD